MKVRKPKPPGSCWMCEDSSEWDIEKYRQQNQVPGAASKSDSSPGNQVHRDAQVSDNPETNGRPSDASITSEKDGMFEDASVYAENKPKDKLNGEDDAEGELEQEQDEDNDMPGNEMDNEGNIGEKLENIEICHGMDSPPQSSLSLSSSSGFPPHSQFAVDNRGLFTLPNAQYPSHASKDVLPRRVNLTPLPIIPCQRSASVPITSNLEPMLLELKQQREQEKSEKQPRGISLDFNLASANSWTPVPSLGFTSLKPPLGVNIESQDSVSATAAVTAQTAISNPPDGSPSVVDSYSPVSTAGNVPRRKAANLMRKIRRLEKETSYIGKRAKRSIKNIHRDYKRELKVLKRKRKKLEMKLRACN
ncbi:hypothetical protein B0T13DRAFT_518718 [Neurospora crassa]|nr:hypothetical protein B0T13DRAFT_518718 [Neurospora crassa]